MCTISLIADRSCSSFLIEVGKLFAIFWLSSTMIFGFFDLCYYSHVHNHTFPFHLSLQLGPFELLQEMAQPIKYNTIE